MARTARWFIALGLTVTLVLVGCAAPQKAAPTPAPGKPAAERPATTAPAPAPGREQQLVEAAKKEGEVVLYTMSWYRGPMEKALAAKYPWLKFTVWDGPSGPAVISRLAEEAKVGRYPADVFIGPEPDAILAVSAGVFQEHTWPNQGWPRQQPTKFFMNLIASAFFPTYNTNLLSASELPKSFEDLKNSKWRGRAAISTSGFAIPLYTAYVLGGGKVDFEKSESFWREVVGNTRPRVLQGYGGPSQMLAAGEFALFLMSVGSSTTDLIWKGASVAPVALEATPVHSYAIGLLKNAPHPNAAQVLIDFFASPDGNLIYSQAQALIANNPEAARIAKSNRQFEMYGMKFIQMPPEIFTPENTERAARFWTAEMPKAAAGTR